MYVFLFFILINALKITAFNVYVINTFSFDVLLYKYICTAILLTAVFAFILKSKHRYLFVLSYILQLIYIAINLSYFIYFHNYLHIFQASLLFSEGVDAFRYFQYQKTQNSYCFLLIFLYFCT